MKIKYKKIKSGKENKIYDIDKLEYSVQEYIQRKNRTVKTIVIANKPLARRDKVRFVCIRCNKETVMNPLAFAKRDGEKYCKGCAITIFHQRNPNWLVLTEDQKKKISKRNSGPRIKEKETRECSMCKKKFEIRVSVHGKRRKYCSRKCQLKYYADYGRKNGGKYGYLGLKPFSYTTKPEIKMKKFLENNKIKFKHSKCIKINKKHHVFDFWLPDYNLFIEVDGDYWHYNKNNPRVTLKAPNKKQLNRIEKDKIKNEYCKQKSIKLIRIWESELDSKLKTLLESLSMH